MRFIVDPQLPPALARWLVTKDHQAEHVGDRAMAASSDAQIWDLAVTISAAVITKDEDFAQRRIRSASGPIIVWIRLPNTRTQPFISWFDTILPTIVAALERGEILIEVV